METPPNVKSVAPPPLESEGVEIEKLMGGCPPTTCSLCCSDAGSLNMGESVSCCLVKFEELARVDPSELLALIDRDALSALVRQEFGVMNGEPDDVCSAG